MSVAVPLSDPNVCRAARVRLRVAAIALIALGVLANGNAVSNQFIGVDTKNRVRDNPEPESLTPLSRAMSLHLVGAAAAENAGTLVRRPLLSLSFAVNRATLGPDAWGFQVVNIAFHLASSLLLLGISRRTIILAGYAVEPRALGLAFAISSIWLVHPLQTESVTNIVQRAESQMALLALFTLYAAIRAWEARPYCPRGSQGWGLASILACALGMGSKDVMVVVPPLVWLYDAIFVSRSLWLPLRRRPVFYLGLASTWLIIGSLVALTIEDVGADFRPDRLPLYLLSQPNVMAHYLKTALWPHPLYHYIQGDSFWYHPGSDSGLSLLAVALPFLVLLGATAMAVIRLSPWGFLGVWYFAILAPTSLIATFTLVQDHRLYLPLVSLVATLVIATDAALTRAPLARWRRPIAFSLLATALATLTCLTWKRNHEYGSEIGVWAPEDRQIAFSMLVGVAIDRGNFGEADDLLRQLLHTPPPALATEDSALPRARVLNAFGALRAMQQLPGEAREYFEQALGMDSTYAPAANNLGTLAFQQGDHEAAATDFRHALLLDPDQAAAHYNLGVVAAIAGDTRSAATHLQRARDLNHTFEQRHKIVQSAADQGTLGTLQFGLELALEVEPFTIEYKLILQPRQAPSVGPD